mgnify:CR=1 FL=1
MIGLWITLAVALPLAVPSLNEMAQKHPLAMLPADAPLAAAQTGLVPARFQFAEDILHELSPFGLCASYRLGGHAGSGKANICKIC